MINLLKKLKHNPKLVYDYLLGNYRQFMYYNFPFMLRKHIIEQYEWRLKIMNQTCLNNGECIKCGCQTPNLQFANKACEGACYPPMVSKKLWNKIKNS